MEELCVIENQVLDILNNIKYDLCRHNVEIIVDTKNNP